MRTEEYVILIPTVMIKDEEVVLDYTSNAPLSNVTFQIKAQSGRLIKSFERVKDAQKGTLSFSSEGIMPGRYTCDILVDGKKKGSKSFSIS